MSFNLKLFFFLFLIILKANTVFAFDLNKEGVQSIFSYLIQGNIIYSIIYVILCVILVYLFYQVFSLSPFSGYVSIIFSFGLVIILSLTNIIGIISTWFYNLLDYVFNKGWSYTLLFLIVILLGLFILVYIIRWGSYLVKGSKKQRKKEKEKLEREEEKSFYEGLKGK